MSDEPKKKSYQEWSPMSPRDNVILIEWSIKSTVYQLLYNILTFSFICWDQLGWCDSDNPQISVAEHIKTYLWPCWVMVVVRGLLYLVSQGLRWWMLSLWNFGWGAQQGKSENEDTCRAFHSSLTEVSSTHISLAGIGNVALCNHEGAGECSLPNI